MQEQTDNLNGDQTHNSAKQILYAGTNIINSEKKELMLAQTINSREGHNMLAKQANNSEKALRVSTYECNIPSFSFIHGRS